MTTLEIDSYSNIDTFSFSWINYPNSTKHLHQQYYWTCITKEDCSIIASKTSGNEKTLQKKKSKSMFPTPPWVTRKQTSFGLNLRITALFSNKSSSIDFYQSLFIFTFSLFLRANDVFCLSCRKWPVRHDGEIGRLGPGAWRKSRFCSWWNISFFLLLVASSSSKSWTWDAPLPRVRESHIVL